MQLVRRSWAMWGVVLVFVLSGCVSGPTPALPTPTMPPREAIVTLSAMLAEPQRWSGQRLVLVSPIERGEAARVLRMYSPTVSATPSASAQPSSAIWLSETLPATITSQLTDEANVVRLRGTLSPPGAYGRDQQFTYQFTAQDVELIQPERTTLANLAENPGALDHILLRLQGTLLVERDSALLVDQVSAGGVPTANGRQLKLTRAAIDEQTIGLLNRSGEVSWGSVEVIGWWQDGALTIFSISPNSSASPPAD